jgi:hypothetical protein
MCPKDWKGKVRLMQEGESIAKILYGIKERNAF